MTPGWRCSRGTWHWGAQCFVFPPAVARSLLLDGELRCALLSASVENHIPIPEVLHDWVRRSGMKVWFPVPSLTQHIGTTSTIWMDAAITEGRRAHWFAGDIDGEFAAQDSMANFAEDVFPCSDGSHHEFVGRVEKGKRRMQDLSAVICGLCRDVRQYLPRMTARIERLGNMFGRYHVVLYENDSIDRTVEFLFDWQAANSHVTVISEVLGAPQYPSARSLDRAAWMAACRNRCRELAVREFPDFEIAIALDMDLAGGWSFDGVAHTFGNQDWDFVGSYGVRRRLKKKPDDPAYVHADLWAFRPASGMSPYEPPHLHKLSVTRGQPLLPVESCFGGLGIYRMDCLRSRVRRR